MALQHPFFQSCYYIPPSLRVKESPSLKTPPSVGISGALDQKPARRLTGPIYNTKPANNLTKKFNSLRPGVQRKLEMENKESEKDVFLKCYPRQAPYPAVRNNHPESGCPSRQVEKLSEKMGQMTMGNDNHQRAAGLQARRQVQMQPPPPPPLKAGGFYFITDRANEIPPSKCYFPRKVRG